jgi:protein-L-isoaspartate(D-aspartate) O-methyltransferase
MDFDAARRNMVEGQIRPNWVTDSALLEALAEVPREAFVPEHMKSVAYVDEDLAVGGGRYLMKPMVLARLIQEAMVKPTDVVLQIGCGAGYTAAVLSRLASTVVALESDASFAERATAIFSELGIDSVAIVEGPLEKGYPEQSPYDVIFFSGAIGEIPPAFADQLVEGGRLVAVVDGGDGAPKGVLATRRGGLLGQREVFDAHAAPLPGFALAPAFAF